ncbi:MULTISPECIES: hypothetical protein [Streptomyces]|uniref:Mce-associated membrane protein n=1 Tax=Streptomyces violaceoruber TaxID=1935 RepID=A0A1V0UKB2_STRVN|nr:MULTISPECIES: hypothetical protein [Streptomyces]ARF65402.1 hypothetical protein B1H20_31285 [Streptomyces violaceoruber]MBD3549944.1 hypothetical protein [Streptomyces sp. JV180]
MREHAGTTTVDGEAVAEAEAREAAAPERERAQDSRTEAEPDGAANGRGEEDADGPEDAARRRWPRVLGALLAVALIVVGGVLYAQGRQLRDTPATANLALTDAAATTRVTGDVSSALTKVFSYAPGSTATTQTAAKQVLAGKALQQYAALFGQVERQAADQKLTLTSEVVRAGVTRLTGDSAHLLVFLDQVYERQGRAPTTAAAQLTVTAELRDGRWWIVEIGSI